MTENTHDSADPDVAPTHLDVRDRFASWQVALATALGTVAIVAGIVLGLVLAND